MVDGMWNWNQSVINFFGETWSEGKFHHLKKISTKNKRKSNVKFSYQFRCLFSSQVFVILQNGRYIVIVIWNYFALHVKNNSKSWRKSLANDKFFSTAYFITASAHCVRSFTLHNVGNSRLRGVPATFYRVLPVIIRMWHLLSIQCDFK